jgi:hypothetical protein
LGERKALNFLAGIQSPRSLQLLKQRGLLVVIALLVVPLLAACAASQAAVTQPVFEDQVETVVAATIQVLPSSTPEPTAGPDCPEPVTGTQLLRNEEYGYCFLFPERYERLDPLPHEVCLVTVGPSMACHGANLIIEVHDASGRTVAQIVDQKIGEHPQPELIQRIGLTVGGEDAVLVDGLSAVTASRNIFIVHEGRLYDLLFIPWDESGDGFADLETLYSMVIDSFTFVP